VTKLLKIFKWVVVVIVSLPVVIYLIWIVGNLSDNALNPELAQLLERRPQIQLSDTDNAYFDILGLSSPNSMSPHEWGVAWFTQASRNDQLISEGKSSIPIHLAGYPPSPQKFNLSCLSNSSTESCIDEIAKDPTEAKQCLAEGALLLRRFDTLLDMEYQEPYRDMTPLSDIATLSMEHQAIRLAEIRFALEVANGKHDVALARWGRETAFILRQAEHSHSLIEKMVLTMALNRYQILLADYLSSHPNAIRTQAKKIQIMLALFRKEAATLHPAFENEAILTAKFMLSPQMSVAELSEGDDSPYHKFVFTLAIPFFDRPATANALSKIQLEYARIASLEGDAYRQALAELSAKRTQQQNDEHFLSYHNPVGKILIQVTDAPDMTKYLYKSDDIIANANLLLTAIDLIIQNKTTENSITVAIKDDQIRLKHPFSGELPRFDAKKRTLSYPAPEGLSMNLARPITIKL